MLPSSTIEISNLNKSFGQVQVLNDVSLAIAAGSFVSILGPSGCGKSTLLRIIAGLEGANSGSISIQGERVEHISAKNRGIAFVFQNYALYPHLTARGNIAAPLVMRELSSWQRAPFVSRLHRRTRLQVEAIENRVEKTAKLLSIESLLSRKPGQLSGGQRQRVALGRALVREPRLFLMDEPLANLDAGLRIHMRSEILDLQRRLGATTLFVTHDQAEAFAMSDKVAIMFGGEVRQFDVPDRLYNDPADLDVARFLSQPYLNVTDVAVDSEGMLTVGPIRMEVADAKGYLGKGHLAFRPEHCSIVEPSSDGALAAVVDHVEYGGSDSHVFLHCFPFNQPVTVRVDSKAGMNLKPGDGCGIVIDGAHSWFFSSSGKRASSKGRA